MAERFDRDADLLRKEARRIAYAARRVAEHADRELELLTRATEAESDACARQLEHEAYAAYEDFIAMVREHGLER